MTSWQALLLGIVQGVTEFLPISSTAHLRLVPALLGWTDAAGQTLDPGAAFTAVTQWGTWLATVVYFRADLSRLLLAWWRGLVSRRPFAEQDSRLAWMIAAATVPIVACGLLLRKLITDKEGFRSITVIAWALIGLAVLLVVAELFAAWRRKRTPEKDLGRVGWFESLFIGLWQAVALVPGASRSGTTITGALFAGLDRPTAARFSFLLSLPAIFGAGLFSLVKDWKELTASGDQAFNLVLATVVAGVVGYASIALLLRFLRTNSTAVFIVYRIALGVALLVMLSRGMIK